MSDLVESLWGAGDVDEHFRGTPKAAVPWPPAGQNKKWISLERDLLATVVKTGPVLAEVDPRELRASQPWVVRQHAVYYLTGEWERSGCPSADRRSPANRFPIVLTDVLGIRRIVTGHHRALAALLRGEPLLARLAPPDNVERAGAVTPTFWYGKPLEKLPKGVRVTADYGELLDHLESLGIDDLQRSDRLCMATHGSTMCEAGPTPAAVLG